MNKLSIFTATMIAITLASPFFGKNSQVFSQEKYDYDIELLFDTRVDVGEPAQDANVTITALDIDMDIQSQTKPLDANGKVLFTNAYTDIPSALFTTIKYDFKINGENLGVNIPNVVSANIYNEVGQMIYSQKFNGYSPVSVPSRLVNMADEKTFVEFKDKDGESYVLRKISSGTDLGFAWAGNWEKTFIQTKDGSKVEVGKGKASTRYEIKIVPNDGSNMEKTEIDTIDVLLQDGRQTFEMYDLEKVRNEHVYSGNVSMIDVNNPSTLTPLAYADMQVCRQTADGTFEVISEFQADAFGDYETPRIPVQDSVCVRIKKEDGQGPIHLTTLKYNETTKEYEDTGWFSAKLVNTTPRTKYGGTDGTGLIGQGKYKGVTDVNFAILGRITDHPDAQAAVDEQNALDELGVIDDMTLETLDARVATQGKTRGNLSFKPWREGNAGTIYLGYLNATQQDSIRSWGNEFARLYGKDNFNDLYTEVADSTQANVIVEEGSNVFKGYETNNSSEVNTGYKYEIITTGGRTFVSMGEKPTKKEIFSRPNWDSTGYFSASSATAQEFTLLDWIFKPMFMTLDEQRGSKGVQSKLYDYTNLPYDVDVKENQK